MRPPRIAHAGLLVLLLYAVASPGQPQTWTINGKSMPLGEFMAQVAEITGKTIVVDGRMRDSEVTVHSDVALDADGVYALFLTVLRANNLGAVEAGDLVTIVQQTQVAKSAGSVEEPAGQPADRMVTRVVPLQHVASSEIVKLMRNLLPAQTSWLTSIDRPNVVVVADYAANMERILALIEQVDFLDEEEVVRRGLEHAWVGTVATILEEIAPDRIGRNAQGPQGVIMVANERDNSLIFKGKARVIAEVLRIVDKLDVRETASNAARVVQLNHADAVTVAPILSELVNRPDGALPQATILPEETLNALVVRAEPAAMNQVLSVISQLDVRRAQVLIEAAVVEISLSTENQQGVEFAAGDARGSSTPILSTTLNRVIGGILRRAGAQAQGADVSFDPLAATASLGSPTIALAKVDPDGVFFGAIVSALAVDTRANLLSTPSVLTLDNMEAVNTSGQQIPFRTGSFTTTTDGASNPFQTIERNNVGVELKVKPHIHDNLSMRLTIDLSVGDVADSEARGGIGIGSGGYADVVTNNRQLQTTILVDDRQIVMLGGLIQDTYSNVGRRVPLLGDIPLLGRAFRSKRQTVVKRHLLMFLRPTVLLSGDDAADLATRRYGGIYRLRDDESQVPIELKQVFKGDPEG